MLNLPAMKNAGIVLASLIAFVLWSDGSFAQTLPEPPDPASIAARTVVPQAGGYVGSERCRSCHKPEFTEFGKTHHATLPERKGSVTGCEMCHGAGQAHTDAEQAAHGDDAKSAAGAKLIFSFHGKAKENSARCLQ
ncbi:MAG TPA: hypothetical protein VHC90_04410, partial [Bryobacteraceae bacterium]|nr:hypothetical protein [Bryobacteraceae bacterium]